MLRNAVCCQEVGGEFHVHSPLTEGDHLARLQGADTGATFSILLYHIVLSSHHSLSSSFSWPSAQQCFNAWILALLFFLTFPIYTK